MGDVALAQELAQRGIRDQRVLSAIASLSRRDFVRESEQAVAALDEALPIGHGQTISQPYVVAFMTQELGVNAGDRVLEVGTGSGYQAAVLARMGVRVYSVELIQELAERARLVLGSLGLGVAIRVGNGAEGWPERAPFDAALVTAAPEAVPKALFDQLSPGGRLIAPVGEEEGYQELIRYTPAPSGPARVERLLGVRFVPMRGTPTFA